MIQMDGMAYDSSLRNKCPEQKIVMAGITLLLCLWADSIAFSVLVFLTMSCITTIMGGVHWKIYIKALFVPGFFLITALVGVATDFSQTKEVFVIHVSLGSWFLGFTSFGLMEAAYLFFRTMGAVSCLYFLTFNTPMASIFGVLKRWKVPGILLELSELMYRLLFVLLETAEKIHIAQSNRLGYMGIRNSFTSLGILCSSLFVRAFKRSEDLYNGLESRGYTGELSFLEEEREGSRKNWMFVGAFIVAMMGTLLGLKYLEGVMEWTR